MPVNINVTELHRILEITPETHNLMLTGKHGIGKSQMEVLLDTTGVIKPVTPV